MTASLVLHKLASYPRHNGLAWGLRELGRIDRTLFMLEWLRSPELRRRVAIGLNKGEAKNALSRAMWFQRSGHTPRRRLTAAPIALALGAYRLDRRVPVDVGHGQVIAANSARQLTPPRRWPAAKLRSYRCSYSCQG